MNIDFDELEDICKKQNFGGDCDIMVENEKVSNMDDPDFRQDCKYCEKFCPLKNSQESKEEILNSAELIKAIDDNCEVVTHIKVQWLRRDEVVEVINSLPFGENNTTQPDISLLLNMYCDEMKPNPDVFQVLDEFVTYIEKQTGVR